MSCFNCPASGIESAIAANHPEALLYPQDLPLLGRELLFGDQAPVFHHGELQNLRPLVVQVSPGRGSSGLECSRLLCSSRLLLRQGLLLRSKLRLLRL